MKYLFRRSSSSYSTGSASEKEEVAPHTPQQKERLPNILQVGFRYASQLLHLAMRLA
jgi:hypothetical protein